MSRTERRDSAAPPNSYFRRPSRWRVGLVALAGTGMLAGLYFAFPPIFADTESAAVVTEKPAGPIEFQSLPDIPLTPSVVAHRHSIKMLEEGVRGLRDLSGYTADFTKEEVVGGEATVPQTMRLKLRHEPFSIYLRWTEGKPGQELLYVEGQNDGKMIVRASGLKGILGAIKLDVNGVMAQKEARHPVTDMGLLQLAESVLEYRYREASWTSGYSCTEEAARVDDRPCRLFTMIYDNRDVSPQYRKSEVWIDEEHLIITKIRNYGWSDESVEDAAIDENTVLEEYTYTNINFDPRLASLDFSASNENYRLERR